MDNIFQKEKCPARMKDQRLGTNYTPNREMNKAHQKKYGSKNSHIYRNHIQSQGKSIMDETNNQLRQFECQPTPEGHGEVIIQPLKADFGSN